MAASAEVPAAVVALGLHWWDSFPAMVVCSNAHSAHVNYSIGGALQ